METNDQVNQDNGDQGNNQQQQQQESLGWRAALPDEYKEHEFVKGFTKPGDFVKAALDIKTNHDVLNEKLGKAIFKPGENATEQEIAAYRAALGVPEKADDYEVELVEGMDNSLAPWFKQTALELGMPKEMAKGLSAKWNAMLQEFVKAGDEARLTAHTEAIGKLKNDWGDKADANAETIKIAYQSIIKDVPNLDPLLKTEVDVGGGKKVLLGDLPAMQELSLWIGKKMLPDTSLRGNPPAGTGATVSMNYDK